MPIIEPKKELIQANDKQKKKRCLKSVLAILLDQHGLILPRLLSAFCWMGMPFPQIDGASVTIDEFVIGNALSPDLIAME